MYNLGIFFIAGVLFIFLHSLPYDLLQKSVLLLLKPLKGMFLQGAIFLFFPFLALLKMVNERTEGSNDSYVSYHSS